MYNYCTNSIRLCTVLLDSICPTKPTLNFDAILSTQLCLSNCIKTFLVQHSLTLHFHNHLLSMYIVRTELFIVIHKLFKMLSNHYKYFTWKKKSTGLQSSGCHFSRSIINGDYFNLQWWGTAGCSVSSS